MRIKESDLFNPLKYYLENQGYTVRSEVIHCDITATKDNELIIIELKTNFSVSLLMQAIKRQESADAVYVAIPVAHGKWVPGNFKGIRKLCRRLELGLILVHFLKKKNKVEIILHPTIYQPRRNHKQRRNLIREIDGRYRNFNLGGSTNHLEKITTYKLEVIRIACLLEKLGQASPAQLKKMGCSQRTGSILSHNFYGWFHRVERGIYRLHRSGQNALSRYPEIVQRYKQEIELLLH